MKFFASLSVLASLASAASVDVGRRSTPLEVKLERTGNSGVHASLSNTGSEDLKLFTTGTFLDEGAVEKVTVFSGKNRLAFDGVRLTVSTFGLVEDAFTIVKAGDKIEVDFDAAELHDLSEGGAFDILSSGAFSYADLDSTDIAGVIPFKSNTLSTTKVDGQQAAAVHKTFQEKAKRTEVQNDCSGSERTATVNGINNCRSLASAARQAANSDSARLQEFFKSTSVGSTVSSVFSRIEDECGSTTSGFSSYHCSDVYGACSPGVIAYTLPSQNYMVNCPTFFTMSAASSQCHAQDQQTTILHEMTHLNQIAGTEDYGGYGYEFVQSLSPQQNLNHADTYTLFAQSIYAGC